MKEESTHATESQSPPGVYKRVELCRDRKAIFLCRDGERCFFDIHEVTSENSLTPIQQFACALVELEAISTGGAINVETTHGHLLVRLSREQVWIVMAVPSENFSESTLIDIADFEQAVTALASN